MRAVRLIGVAAFGVIVAACGGGGGYGGDGNEPPIQGPIPTPKDKLALKNFSGADNCAEFKSYAADGLTEQYLQPFYQCLAGSFAPCPVYLEDTAGAPAAGEGAPSAAPGRVSGTNTQEAGVDEADIVKADSDGNLYILSGKNLFVLDAFPPAGLADRPLVALDLSAGNPNFYANDFFLDEATHRLVVLGQSYADAASRVVNVIVDVANPAAPAEVSRIAVDGYALEARRVGSRVHRVSRFDVPLPAWFYDGNDPLNQKRVDYNDARSRGDETAMAAIKAEARVEIGERVDAAGADSLLPQLRANGATTTLDCSQVARPDVPEGLGLVVIDSFNTNGGTRATSAAVNNGWVVYGSSQNLYVAQSSFGWRFDVAQAEETAIYRFSLSETGAAVYQGVGKVPGTINGSYSMSESDGHLRVASTETRYTATPDSGTVTTYNHLDVLRANQPGSDLNVVGAVHDFAPGERIQGVRFVGDRGYVVTFRQIDPLFAFNLANPAQPAIASELKIPGFSSYLSPIGEDYLLTVGREGLEDGTLTGRMQISLFDVRNLGNVQVVDQLVPDDQPTQSYSYSAAEYDPHAFAYFADDPQSPSIGTLAIPLQSYGDTPEQQFAGFLVVRVDAGGSGLSEVGRVDHSSLATDRFCDGGGVSADESQPPCSPGIYAAEPRRAVFMQESAGSPIDLFTISLVGVVASNAAQPSQELGRKELPFDPPYYCCFVGPAEGGGGGGAVPPGG
jgi:hypothetical protein